MLIILQKHVYIMSRANINKPSLIKSGYTKFAREIFVSYNDYFKARDFLLRRGRLLNGFTFNPLSRSTEQNKKLI